MADADRPDPLDVLRRPAAPLAPSPAFAADLRRRLEAALGRPPDPATDPATGGTMSTIETTDPSYLHRGQPAVVPYLVVRGAADAIRWYQDVFGAVEVSPAFVGDDGRVGHAEISIGGAVVMLADEYPEVDALSPDTVGGTPVTLSLHVPDADATVARAEEAGATVLRPVELQGYGDRSGAIVDPWGHKWSVNTHVEDMTTEEMNRRFADDGFTIDPQGATGQGVDEPSVPLVADEPGRRAGDIFYWTFGVVDGERARTFFGQLFGWDLEDGHVPGAFHIASVTPPGGMHPADAPSKTIYFRVPDIQVAVARVRELGGTATDPVLHDSGWDSTCTDGQGTEFNLSQPAPKYA